MEIVFQSSPKISDFSILFLAVFTSIAIELLIINGILQIVFQMHVLRPYCQLFFIRFLIPIFVGVIRKQFRFCCGFYSFSFSFSFSSSFSHALSIFFFCREKYVNKFYYPYCTCKDVLFVLYIYILISFIFICRPQCE